VPLITGVDINDIPEFEIQTVTLGEGRQVNLRLNKNGEFIGEKLMACNNDPRFVRADPPSAVLDQHICWYEGYEHDDGVNRPGGIEANYACILDTLLFELRVGRLSRTPIPYVPYTGPPVEVGERHQPEILIEFEEWPIRHELLCISLPHFGGGGLNESRRLDFLINLGRKIKHQRHSCFSGEWAEIPYCYYEHIRSALDTMRVPLRREERTSTIEYLRGIMTTLVGNFHEYKEPLCWMLKRAIHYDMDYLITIDDFNRWEF